MYCTQKLDMLTEIQSIRLFLFHVAMIVYVNEVITINMSVNIFVSMLLSL